MGDTGIDHVAGSKDIPVTKDNDTATSSLCLDETVKQLIATASSSSATKPQYQASKPGTDLSWLGINNVCNKIRRDLNTLVYLTDNKNSDKI